MDEARIKVIRERNLKKKKRNEENYQAGGEIIYSSRARGFEELVEICDIALSVSSIRDNATSLRIDLMKRRAELKTAIAARDYPEMLRCCENIERTVSKYI